MKYRFIISIMLFGSLLLFNGSLASDDEIKTPGAVKKAFQKAFPEIKIDEVSWMVSGDWYTTDALMGASTAIFTVKKNGTGASISLNVSGDELAVHVPADVLSKAKEAFTKLEGSETEASSALIEYDGNKKVKKYTILNDTGTDYVLEATFNGNGKLIGKPLKSGRGG